MLQIPFAASSYLKIFGTIYLFGLEGAGVTGIAISILFLFTITSGLINNQALQVIFINENSTNKVALTTGFIQVLVINGLLATIIASISINSIFELTPLLLLVFIAAIWSSLYNALFEFHAVVSAKPDLIMIGHTFGSLVFLALLVSIREEPSSSPLLFVVPAIANVAVGVAFFVISKIDSITLSYNNTFGWYSLEPLRVYFKYFKKVWRFAMIPVAQGVCDYIIRQLLVINNGFSSVGFLQLIQSLDALVGNIFAAPVLRKSLFYFSTTPDILFSAFRFFYVNLAVPVILLLITLPVLVYFVAYAPEYYYEKIELMIEGQILIYIFLGSKLLNLLWGLCAQLLLSDGRNDYVATIELGSRALLVILFCIFYYSVEQSVGAYVYGYGLLWVLLLPLCLITILRNTSHKV
jgi:hypothetical protein